MAMYGGDEVGAAVLEVAASSTRIGWAGEDSPKVQIPTHVASVSTPDAEGTTTAEKRRLFDGCIVDYDMYETLLSHAFSSSYVTPREHPLLVVEKPFAPKNQREKVCELLFEKFQSQAAFLAKDPVLATFANGRHTGLVVDVGYSTTTVTPVYEGFALLKPMQYTGFGSEDLVDALALHLQRDHKARTLLPQYAYRRVQNETGEEVLEFVDNKRIHESYHTFRRREVVGDVLKSLCRISEEKLSLSERKTIPAESYELPDGTKVSLGEERFLIPEIIFNSEVSNAMSLAASFIDGKMSLGIGADRAKSWTGVGAMVHSCIKSCDPDIVKDMCANVVVAGGISQIHGFSERLQAEIAETSPSTYRIRLYSSQGCDRQWSQWIGGSILASLGSFQQMWFSKQEYEEFGMDYVHKRCP